MALGCPFVKVGKVTVEVAKPFVCDKFLRNSSSRVSAVDASSPRAFGGVVKPVVLEARSTSLLEERREEERDGLVFTLPSLFFVVEELTVSIEVCLVRFISSGTSRVPTAGAGVLGVGDRARGLVARSGCAATNALKLGSVLGSGMVQGNRRKIMHMKIMATLHTSVFLGS